MDLASPVQFVKGVGPQRAEALAREGVTTLEDLLFHLPMRYEDRTALACIGDLRPGMKVSVAGTIAVAGLRRARRLTLYEVRLEDGTGRLKALWFNQPFLKDTLPRGAQVVLYGTVEPDAYGSRQLMMSSPQYEKVESEDAAGVHTGRIVPVYEKLGPLTGKTLRRILLRLAEQVPDDLPDPLPKDLRERLAVIPRAEALRRIHRPREDDDLALLSASRSPAHRRLILEEFFLFQLGHALQHQARQERPKRAALAITDGAREAVKRILPFHLTGAQKRVLREIADDMKSPHPMNRLVQGDVGSGKTMVALLSMVVALENGYQAAFMAPTEILAEQHYLTFKRLLARCPYTVGLFTSAVKGKERTAAGEALAAGTVQIAVGTHALIQQDVAFRRLGLAVVDEQHRFGVLQREDLRRKGGDVDVLVMTATPIPRTLALTAYGDLDVSVVDERPPGRTPIRTVHRAASDRRAVVEEVRRALAAGRQAYVVYPLVEESDKLEDVRAATQMAEEWRAALPAARIGLLHGRLKGPEKEQVMGAFYRAEVDVLVATTVVEVGVDVPNATVMVIEHAERFGLSQLHQLRGRVGRGTGASTCLLVTHGRLSDEARARIDVLTRSDDGFVIAEKDLELRGPGDFFGTRQSGLPHLRVGDLLRDGDLMAMARAEAFRYVEQARGAGAMGPLEELLERGGWQRRFGLARVG
ncbi:MAG TPA: ATP-dependent DNA helicase RecG [Vicinamibacteria bacterium]|nr:ATP-dependent DNA helicase RecG [Vicinamibacteria bacterium]